MTTVTVARVRPRRRRILATFASLFALVTTGGYWLADNGALALSGISPSPKVTANGGKTVTYAPITAAATLGGVTDGYTIGKLTLAQGFAPGTRLSLVWTDKQVVTLAGKTSAFLIFQLFYPTHTGSCTGSDTGTVFTINDGGNLCIREDTNATSSLGWASDSHALLITSASTPMRLSGWMTLGTSDPTSGTCGSSGTTWCSVSGTTNTAYVLASIIFGSSHLTNANLSQLSTNALHFFVQTRAAT